MKYRYYTSFVWIIALLSLSSSLSAAVNIAEYDGRTHQEFVQKFAGKLQALRPENQPKVLVLTIDNKPVGLITYHPNQATSRAVITKLYLAPNARKKGYGAQLIQSAIAKIQQSPEIKTIAIYVNPRSALNNVVKKLGFQQKSATPRANVYILARRAA